MASSAIPNAIRIEKEIRTQEAILGDEGDIVQLLLNLILNASQAIGERDGLITLSAWGEDGMLNMAVTDNGPGIDKENLPHIFEPFFTTKGSEKGTGLGLAIAQKTAENHKGTITATNNPEGGATFTLSFPLYK